MTSARLLLSAAFTALLLAAQTPPSGSKPGDRFAFRHISTQPFHLLPQSFPPDIVFAPTRMEARRWCVQPALEKKSFSMKPCEPAKLPLRLFTPAKPAARPADTPDAGR